MGFGCNACGVMGCRIIDSPRERLIAILTNSLVPCNGRFPTLIAVLTMFFAAGAGLRLHPSRKDGRGCSALSPFPITFRIYAEKLQNVKKRKKSD